MGVDPSQKYIILFDCDSIQVVKVLFQNTYNKFLSVCRFQKEVIQPIQLNCQSHIISLYAVSCSLLSNIF